MKNILLIDDDLSLCMLLEQILSKQYRVSSCNSAMDALCWLVEGNFPSLIITDIIMPSLTGIELVEKIRESGMLSGIPIIILSGLDDTELRKKCVELGVNSFLHKPFTPDLLIETIARVLNANSNGVNTEEQNNKSKSYA